MARRQHAGEVVDELLREGAADEQRAGAAALDLTGDGHAFADHRLELEGGDVALVVHAYGAGAPQPAGAERSRVAAVGLGEQEHVEGGDGRLDDLVQRVADHAAGGHDHARRSRAGRRCRGG